MNGKNYKRINPEVYRVASGPQFRLKTIDPNESRFFAGDKDAAEKLLEKLRAQLIALQEVLFAQHEHKILLVLQAMDTGGKDGTVRHVFQGVNIQGLRVANFKAPTAEELDHDYLWRIHRQVPRKGEIAIFNRSHYEDVLVVRVHRLVPKDVWEKRFQQIKEFERMLAEEGTTIIKFFLHIDRAEQKERLLERLKDKNKEWKFNLQDIEERKLWPEYMKAYEDVLWRTSTVWAPWYVIPANKKWYRNLLISQIIVANLQSLKLKYPPSTHKFDKINIP